VAIAAATAHFIHRHGMAFVSIGPVSAKHALTVGIGFIVFGLGCGDGARPFGGEPFDPPGSGGSIGSAGASGAIGSVGISLPGSGGGSAHPTDGTGGVLGMTSTGGNPAAGTGGVGGRVSDGSGGSSLATGGVKAPGATGGSPATGGARGTGGAGTGGAPTIGTGGAKGTGGAGTGGAGIGGAGTGGANATGGAGTGGAGTGGANGTGGATTGTGGATTGTGGASATTSECRQYKDDYEAELQNTRSCKGNKENQANQDNKEKSCATLVPSKLTGCGSECETFVDKSAMLDQIQKKWAKAGCVAERCLISICVTPVASSCSAVTELCTDGFLGL